MLDDRQRLAESQAELVRALWRVGEAPGFDPVQVRRAGDALQRKRERTVSRAWPALAQALGESYSSRFRDYSAGFPLPEGGPAADGRLFARYLEDRGILPPETVREVLLFDATWRLLPDGRLRRRGAGVVIRRSTTELLLALRLGGLRRLLRLPWPRWKAGNGPLRNTDHALRRNS